MSLRFSDSLSIKRKLVGIILATSLTVLGLTGGALLLFEVLSSRTATARNLAAIADVVAENSSAALIFDDHQLAQELISGLHAEPEVIRAALFNQDGRMVASYPIGLPAAAMDHPGRDGIRLHLTELSIVKPVLQRDRRVGTILIHGTFAGTYRRLGMYGLVLLAVMAASVFLALVLSNFLHRVVSEPLLNLAKTAGLVAAHQNYSVRATKMSSDELGILTDAFNTMLDTIEGAQSALREARDKALVAARAKDDFLAALSHELRTPLSPVLLLASDAAQDPELPLPVRETFETIRTNVELEAKLIDDLLDLTRVTRGKLVLDRQTVRIHSVLADALRTVQSDIAGKQIGVVQRLDPGDPTVSGDPVRLQQVLWNILKNAAKFTPAGGQITITTEAQAEAGEVKIVIADTGIGMTPEEIDRIFEAFTQGDHAGQNSAQRFGGLGLGLAISRSIVALHTGRLVARSEGRGRGSQFEISLPLAARVATSQEGGAR